jgi:hypothetical protein
MTLDVSGVAGKEYELSVWNPAQIASVEGAELAKATTSTDDTKLKIHFPAAESEAYVSEKIVIHFIGKSGTHP